MSRPEHFGRCCTLSRFRERLAGLKTRQWRHTPRARNLDLAEPDKYRWQRPIATNSRAACMETVAECFPLVAYVSPVLPVCLGHPEASGRGSPNQTLLFWGERHNGRGGRARTGTLPQAKQKLGGSAETEVGIANRPETVTDMVARSHRRTQSIAKSSARPKMSFRNYSISEQQRPEWEG